MSNMSKINLISRVLNYNPQLVWEIDDSKFYGLISGNGLDTGWLGYELEQMTNAFLSELIGKLNEEHLKNFDKTYKDPADDFFFGIDYLNEINGTLIKTSYLKGSKNPLVDLTFMDRKLKDKVIYQLKKDGFFYFQPIAAYIKDFK